MKVVILQPGYLPWLGFFDQMNWADIFVIYDDVQYTKRDWRSRNRIKTPDGIQWLTVPVYTKQRRTQLINEVKINFDSDWQRSHVHAIKYNYSKAAYFEKYFPALEKILTTKYEYLIDLNMAVILYLQDVLRINADILRSNDLRVNGKGTERLVNICLKIGATEYLTGDAANQYLDTKAFIESGIKVAFHNYKHPIYPQLWNAFIPYLSVIDLLFNCGPRSLDYIT